MVPVPFELTFDIMSTSGSLACINISIPQDMALEGDHEFTVHLLPPLSPDVVTVASPLYTTVVIADDESKCVYGFMVVHMISMGTVIYAYIILYIYNIIHISLLYIYMHTGIQQGK